MTEYPPQEFDDLFDEDGEVKVTEQAQPPAPPTHIINNSNQQLGAEFNVFFKNPLGFKCHLKLHGPTGREVLETAGGALAYLATNGFIPEYNNGNGAAKSTTSQDSTAGEQWCDIHKAKMDRKENEHGAWYSHKTDDPAYADKKGWCNGKPRS